MRSDRIAPIMKQAIVAVEDKRFFEHNGVDMRGIVRAAWEDIRNKAVVEGGSTITQQYVKNAYSRNDKTIARKVREAALAWQLTQRWSKDRILTAYLNTIYFGNGAYGILQASRTYFHGKSADELTLPEAALLAGIPASPSLYDPVQHPVAAKQRRGYVLQQLFDQGRITAGELRRANATPLPKPEDVRLPGTRGPAPYFVNYVTDQLVARYGAEKVFGGGLEVTTTIDLDLQERAREAIERDPPRPEWAGGRARRDRPAHRRGEGDVRRHELPPQPVQPRHAGRAPAGLVVQAHRARGRAAEGHRAGHAHHVEADRDRRRRPHLAGEELRRQLPRQRRPDDGDGPLRQLRLRPADEHRRAEGDRRDGAPARDPLEAPRLLLDRPRLRRGQPARHGPRLRHDRERRKARGRLDHEGPAARRPERRLPPRAARWWRTSRWAMPPSRPPRRRSSPACSRRSSRRARARARSCPAARSRARRARTTTTRTPGSSATRPTSSSPSGSATRTSSSRWRRSSTASRWREARCRLSSGRRSWAARSRASRRRRSPGRPTYRATTPGWCIATANGAWTTASVRRRA